MQTFNAPQLEAQLSKLANSAQVAFALACALRLSSQVAEPHPLASHARALALESLHAPAGPLPRAEAILAELESSPELDRDDVAVSFYALACLARQDMKSAFWAAQRAYEAADSAAQRALEFSTFSPGVEATLIAHPLVQQELERQAQDLALLKEHPERAMLVVARARET